MIEGKRNIIQGLLQEYDIETAEDIQEAYLRAFSPTIIIEDLYLQTFVHTLFFSLATRCFACSNAYNAFSKVSAE